MAKTNTIDFNQFYPLAAIIASNAIYSRMATAISKHLQKDRRKKKKTLNVETTLTDSTLIE